MHHGDGVGCREGLCELRAKTGYFSRVQRFFPREKPVQRLAFHEREHHEQQTVGDVHVTSVHDRGVTHARGDVGLALGLWPAGEPQQVVRNMRVEGNQFLRCDRGIKAAATEGGAFAAVHLAGNSFTECRVPLDVGGAPGIEIATPPD